MEDTIKKKKKNELKDIYTYIEIFFF